MRVFFFSFLSVVILSLVLYLHSGEAVDISDALTGFVENQGRYACSTREDCCLKAQSTLRSLVYTATSYETELVGSAIYPKCNRGWNYNRFSDTCSKTVPFSPIMTQTAFEGLTECLNVTSDNENSGNYYQRQKECLRPFWMVHEECIRRTFNNCLKQDGRCSQALFDDWNSITAVDEAYDDEDTE